jgi:hypothetical protein
MVWIELAQDKHQMEESCEHGNSTPSLGWGGMVWIELAQDMHQYGNLVNTVIKLLV